jgi:hypothetical protein
MDRPKRISRAPEVLSDDKIDNDDGHLKRIDKDITPQLVAYIYRPLIIV